MPFVGPCETPQSKAPWGSFALHCAWSAGVKAQVLKACSNCHSVEHEIWSNSGHGRAYDTLRKINKAFDPECLVCHVVGFNLPGGFISEVDTPELKNVQCEVCHGPGRNHALTPQAGFGNKATEACKKCHVKNHSPRFNYAEYWPRIKH